MRALRRLYNGAQSNCGESSALDAAIAGHRCARSPQYAQLASIAAATAAPAIEQTIATAFAAAQPVETTTTASEWRSRRSTATEADTQSAAAADRAKASISQ